MTLEPTDFFSANAAVLKKRHSQAWETVQSSSDVHGTLVTSPSGIANLRLADKSGNTFFLHDPENPTGETAAYLEAIPADTNGVVILLGMGMGYLAKALLEQRPTLQYLVIFELDIPVFRQALSVVDLVAVLEDPRTILCLNPTPDIPKVMAPAALACYLESFYTLRHPPALRSHEEAYQAIRSRVFEYASMLQVEGKTISLHGRQFVDNRFANLQAMHHHDLLENLQGSMENLPAILVAAGPSLNQNIHLLREARGKAVIFAVDTALPASLAHDIQPHFISAIDAHTFSYEKIADSASRAKGSSLLCMPWVHPRFPKFFPADQVFWAFSADSPMDLWMQNMVGGSVAVSGATTVAHLNLIAARTMGCSPIIFVGQDLAFTGQSTHVDGTVLTYSDPGKNASAEKFLWTPGVDGANVPTVPAFFGMKRHFERLMAEHPGHYINATAAGVHLEGTEVQTLQDALSNHCQHPTNVSRLHEKGSKPSPSGKDVPTRLRDMSGTLEKSTQVIKQARQAIRTAEKNMLAHGQTNKPLQSPQQLPPSLQKSFQEVDRLCRRVDGVPGIWPILDEITFEGLKQRERHRHAGLRLVGTKNGYEKLLSLNLAQLSVVQNSRSEAVAAFQTLCATTQTYMEKERGFLKRRQENPQLPEILQQLAGLYYAADELHLLDQIAGCLITVQPGYGLAWFHRGVIAARQARWQDADTCFSEALRLDGGCQAQLNAFQKTWGEEYLAFAQRYRGNQAVYRRLLLKGLRNCPDHNEINHAIVTLLTADCSAATDEEGAGTHTHLIHLWGKALADNANLAGLLSSAQQAVLLRCYGQVLLAEINPRDALVAIQRAISLEPSNPDGHILATDTHFALGDLDKGIAYLAQAVALDTSYARFWIDIGDDLQDAGQFQDALAAYEQAFTALPEQTALLKEIATCYQALGQDEAAREALAHFASKQEKP